jgi:CDP-diacylglycerol---glycerol-3-phosphate 3-phosphatidyltransferase
VNLPTYITLVRIGSIPLLIWVLTSSRFSSANGQRELLACAVFLAASLTDVIDGYLARRRSQVTTLGMLLDPVADKLLIAAAFVTLVQFNPRVVAAWMVVIIVGREFLVSGLRSIAASEGITIKVSDISKVKMFVQVLCVVAAILEHHWEYLFGLPLYPIALTLIWVMVALAIWSSADYFFAFWKRAGSASPGSERRKHSFELTRRRKRNDVPAI